MFSFDFGPKPCPVRQVMDSLGYPYCHYSDAMDWLEHVGTVARCPAVEPEDVEAIDNAYSPNRDADTGEVEPYRPDDDDPAWWPDFEDSHRLPEMAARMGMIPSATNRQQRYTDGF